MLIRPQEMRLSRFTAPHGGPRALTPAVNNSRGAPTEILANKPAFPKAKALATQERHLGVSFVVVDMVQRNQSLKEHI
jgi:hypothetical protein